MLEYPIQSHMWFMLLFQIIPDFQWNQRWFCWSYYGERRDSGPYDLPVPSDCGRMKKYQILMHSLGLHCLDYHKWLKTVCYDTVLQAATRHFSFADYSIRSFGAVSRRIEECRISLSDGMIHDSGSLLVYCYFACIDLLFLCKCVSRNSQIQVSLVMRQITLVVGSWGTDTSLERLGCFILTYFFCVEILC